MQANPQVVMTIILGTLTTLSLVITLWQFFVACRFPLHRRQPIAKVLPPVSILKPLKGCDSETQACLASWFQQAYPAPVQMLFGVSSAEDPVCGLIKNLMAAHPGVDVQLLVCPPSVIPNRKVAKLSRLMSEVKHEVLVISDADVRVPPDFLEQTVSHLQRERAALVNCLYRLVSPPVAAMQWEAVAINSDFWSQVLQAASLGPLDFALGAAMVTTQTQVRAIGGFTALGDYLADDFELGHRMARNGGKILLSPLVVECREGAKEWVQVWKHQLRWARTVRFCKPAPYFFSVLGNATLWPLLFLIFGNLGGAEASLVPAGWLSQGHSLPQLSMSPTLLAFFVCILVRLATAIRLQNKLTGLWDHLRWWWMIPVKDIAQVLLWMGAFLGNEVIWGGERLRVQAGGKLPRVLTKDPT